MPRIVLQRLRRHTYLHALHFGSPISATESGLTIPRGFSSKDYFQGSCDLTSSEAASSLNGNAYAYSTKTLSSSVRLPPRLLPDGLVLGGVPYCSFVHMAGSPSHSVTVLRCSEIGHLLYYANALCRSHDSSWVQVPWHRLARHAPDLARHPAQTDWHMIDRRMCDRH